jgi:2-polyprenyl-3-methyl-5-hydroxy-6-metoxy-1,4-benzoquinol methylase
VRSCCNARGCDGIFGRRFARRVARRYRKRGLDKTARAMVAFLERRGIEGATVLEIGGGVGGLQIELMRRGAAGATNVELSPAYETAAADLLCEQGLEARVERRVLDFARDGSEMEPADVVVMHRVVCCSPDVGGLVGAAAEHARRVLALSFPRDRWWIRAAARTLNAGAALIRWDWRFYVHPPAAIVAAAEERGLRLVREEPSGPFWQVAALER